jgi:hypothetical protein
MPEQKQSEYVVLAIGLSDFADVAEVKDLAKRETTAICVRCRSRGILSTPATRFAKVDVVYAVCASAWRKGSQCVLGTGNKYDALTTFDVVPMHAQCRKRYGLGCNLQSGRHGCIEYVCHRVE